MTTSSSPVGGFIGPPEWVDPSPIEFETLTGVRSIGCTLDPDDFDWSLDRIGACEPELGEAAVALAGQGATVIGIVGTPFGWAGLDSGEQPHDRDRRITEMCGTPAVSAVTGIVDWLRRLDVTRVALAVTYYDDTWRDRWAEFVARAGFSVTRAASMADLRIVEPPLDAADPTHWAPTPEQLEASVSGVLTGTPADAVVVSGAGARTLALDVRLRKVAGVPVIGSDTALYRAMCVTARVPLPGIRAFEV